jgi:hypothetical protein
LTASKATPVRSALTDDSALQSRVQDGLGAVPSSHRHHFADAVRTAFADSIDIDDALRIGREREHRWDYLLGHAASGAVVAVEPHAAKDDEISAVIAKRAAARDQLKDHLRPGARVSRWLWVASSKVCFANTEKARLRLDQNGIAFVGTQVQAKHLPPAAEAHQAITKKAGRKGEP